LSNYYSDEKQGTLEKLSKKNMEKLTDQIGHYVVDKLQVDGGHHPFDSVYLTH
jgi:hypothetical protein